MTNQDNLALPPQTLQNRVGTGFGGDEGVAAGIFVSMHDILSAFNPSHFPEVENLKRPSAICPLLSQRFFFVAIQV